MIRGDVEQDADASDRGSARDRSGTTSTRSRGRGPAPAARATGSRCRCCRRSARRGRRCCRRCAISAVVVDLPLVPVMATNGASGAMRRRSRQNSSMSPIISTPAARACSTVQCGVGMGERHAGREHQRGEPRPVGVAQVGDRDARPASPARCAHRCRPSATTSAPPANSALRGGEARAAEPEHRDLRAGEGP